MRIEPLDKNTIEISPWTTEPLIRIITLDAETAIQVRTEKGWKTIYTIEHKSIWEEDDAFG